MAEFEIRDPIHKRIPFNALEHKVIDHPFVQRLRFISQLSFLQAYVYPGATHDRFSHVLGAMHVAGRLAGRMRTSLEGTRVALGAEVWDELAQVMRLAGLLHDVGHGPFSHASESVFPKLTSLPLNNSWWVNGERPMRQARHEDYSVLLVQTLAEDGVLPQTMAQDVASLIHEEVVPSTWFEDLEHEVPRLQRACKALISGEVDCDRMDYLLRDSYYCGVAYGMYDLDWLISSLGFAIEDGQMVLQLSENGVRAFEDMLLARYHMIDQVYFHKTAVGFTHYLTQVFREREIDLVIPSDPYTYASLRDGKVVEMMEEAAVAEKYWSKHLMRRVPAKHVMRFHEEREKDRLLLGGLMQLCKREAIRFFVVESRNALSKVDVSGEKSGLFVARKMIHGYENVPIAEYSDLLKKYNEKIRFTDFYVLREDREKFQQAV
ncbi:HD domain-containing protein [Candidatus Uhrbacteria bacterium]|nr:HD domain-containing protein [Candidatus Uhrbacteria bacterium]